MPRPCPPGVKRQAEFVVQAWQRKKRRPCSAEEPGAKPTEVFVDLVSGGVSHENGQESSAAGQDEAILDAYCAAQQGEAGSRHGGAGAGCAEEGQHEEQEACCQGFLACLPGGTVAGKFRHPLGRELQLRGTTLKQQRECIRDEEWSLLQATLLNAATQAQVSLLVERTGGDMVSLRAPFIPQGEDEQDICSNPILAANDVALHLDFACDQILADEAAARHCRERYTYGPFARAGPDTLVNLGTLTLRGRAVSRLLAESRQQEDTAGARAGEERHPGWPPGRGRAAVPRWGEPPGDSGAAGQQDSPGDKKDLDFWF